MYIWKMTQWFGVSLKMRDKGMVQRCNVASRKPDNFVLGKGVKTELGIRVTESPLLKNRCERDRDLLSVDVDGRHQVRLVVNQLSKVAAARVEVVDATIVTMMRIQEAPELL